MWLQLGSQSTIARHLGFRRNRPRYCWFYGPELEPKAKLSFWWCHLFSPLLRKKSLTYKICQLQWLFNLSMNSPPINLGLYVCRNLSYLNSIFIIITRQNLLIFTVMIFWFIHTASTFVIWLKSHTTLHCGPILWILRKEDNLASHIRNFRKLLVRETCLELNWELLRHLVSVACVML